MDKRHLRRMAALSISSLLATTHFAAANPIITPFPDKDAGYNALTSYGIYEQGTAEGRIGSRTELGSWELALWRRVQAGPFLNLGQLNWGNGQAAPFRITYDGATSLSYTLGTTTINTNGLGGTFTDIFIRVSSARNSSVTLTGMQFQAAGLIGSLSATNEGDLQYLRISNSGVAFPAFTITGMQTLTWLTIDPPVNSQLNAQFRLANIVPAPGSAALLSLSLAFVAQRRRRS